MSIGIIGFGTYIPHARRCAEEIAQLRHHDVEKIKSGLGIHQKSIPAHDEDAATIAVQAARLAIDKANIPAEKLGAIYVGSESHPYAVKPTATIVGCALNAGPNYMAADLEFACKAGTAALQICYGLVKAGMVEYALAIGSDTAQAAPGDMLEYSAAAGGAAFIIGNDPEKCIATIDTTCSVASNTPDFWRRPHQEYPSHTNRFTGEPSYFSHVIQATKKILELSGLNITDFAHVIFHQPNGKFPLAVAKKLGFTKQQLELGFLVPHIGNTYSANSLLSLGAVLDGAEAGQKILLVSYGSGSGSDAFVLTKQ